MADVTGTFYAIADDVEVGYGAQWKIGDGASPEGFEAVAGVMSIKPGATKVADIKITHLMTPNRHHEHRAGMMDTDPFVMTGFLLNHESQTAEGGGSGSFTAGGLKSMAEDGVNRNHQIVTATGAVLAFRGYVAEFTPGEFTTDDKGVEFTASVQPTGAWTLTPAA